MTILTDRFAQWASDVQLPGNISQDEATDILQVAAPGLTNQQGDDWWVAVATLYDGHGIINQPTYVQLRNHADGNEAGANALFSDLQHAIVMLPETVVLVDLFNTECLTQRLAAVPGHITTITVLRDAATDSDLIAAYNTAIANLQQLEQDLTLQLGL